MSTVITGDAGNVSGSLVRTVFDASNTTPIVITTTVPHLYATGDHVTVINVTGNLGANTAPGTFRKIIVLSPTTFSMTGSVGTGAYVSGGTVHDVSLTPQFQIPSDGDPFSVSSVNAAFSALADRTQFLQAASVSTNGVVSNLETLFLLGVETHNVNQTLNPPAHAGKALLIGWGAGGGGGGGSVGTLTANRFNSAGGGGGGATLYTTVVDVVPATSYDIIIGSGIGSGGSATADNASDGGDTIFKITAGATLATFQGGGKGRGSTTLNTDTVTTGLYTFGGMPAHTSVTTTKFTTLSTSAVDAAVSFSPTLSPPIPQQGACGTASTDHNYAPNGGSSPQGFAGGSTPASGTSAGAYQGGGAGGGGGAGPLGAGGAGGAGGNAAMGGTSVNGGVGTAAPVANSGAGGGGGGSSGYSDTAVGTAGAGGDGANGKLFIVWLPYAL